MSFSRRTLSIVTVALIATGLGGGIWWRLKPRTANGAEPASTVPEDSATAQVSEAVSGAFSTDIPQPVSGVSAVKDTLWMSVTAAGRAEAVNRVTLQAQVSGVVEGISVKENSPVGQGQALILIDTTEYVLEVARAESDLRRARADYQQKVLFDDRITDPRVKAQREQVARATSGLDQAEVALKQSQIKLARSRVQAPFGGRVADLKVVPGQQVNVGAQLMTIVDLDPIKVEVNVLEAEMGLLSEGKRASVRFAAFPGETFQGSIATVNPVVDPEKRTGRVTVQLANPGGRIKPGMYAEVQLAAAAFPDRILVPRTAILERGDGVRRKMLFVYHEEGDAGRAEWRYVHTGRENDSLVELVAVGDPREMVQPGEVVLTNGHHYLSHDTRVRLVENVEAAGGRPGGG